AEHFPGCFDGKTLGAGRGEGGAGGEIWHGRHFTPAGPPCIPPQGVKNTTCFFAGFSIYMFFMKLL
ncbi:MAG TPA: hypothetical protein VFK74_09055, partial [Azospira sp.]|nr:hypothetical protein [Azospira sp.]